MSDVWRSDCLRLGQLLARPKIIKGTSLRSANHLSFLGLGALGAKIVRKFSKSFAYTAFQQELSQDFGVGFETTVIRYDVSNNRCRRTKIIKGTSLCSANHLSFLLVGVCLERGNLDFCGSHIYKSPKGAVKTSSMSDLLSPLRGQIGSLRDQIYLSPSGR
ncbi:hypothetical protein ACFL5Z_07350 [Planctomycetota bacterium]